MALTAANTSENHAARRSTCLLKGATAANSAPSGATAGVSMAHVDGATDTGIAFRDRPPGDCTVLVKSSAGSGVMTAVVRLWGYNSASEAWYPLGAGTDADKGKINATGFTMGETGTDVIRHAEPVAFPGHFDRLYAELVSVGGVATAVDVFIVVPRTASLD